MTQEEVVAGVVDVLERLGVVYMVAGSFASNFHGVPRMTQDADLVIEIDEPGVVRLVRALEKEFYVSEDAAREADTILSKDACAIVQIQGSSLDWSYLERWADDLGVRDLLDRARRDQPLS